MKNKLLVTLFAVVAVSLAFTSCKPKSDAQDVCDDLLKTSLHKSPRSLLQLKGETLTIKEFEFASANVNDNRIIYREISFGNGVDQTKKVLNLTYEYGDWNDNNTGYSLTFNPATPYASAWYSGNSFITPDGLAFGGEGNANTTRVEKWEKTLSTFLNTKWKGVFEDELVLDSVMRDSIRTRYIPSTASFVFDTIKIWTGKMDTLNRDTTCTYEFEFNRDASTFANTGTFSRTSVRSKYDRATKTADTISMEVEKYNYEWFFSEVSSDSKFKIVVVDPDTKEQKDILDISKYKYEEKQDTTTVPPTVKRTREFLRGGLTYKCQNP
jgi:hypothetical protein